ncbi:MAG TPA: hypothetical protein VLC06_28605 [Polyangia bacterium]|nr:hypothetical protein [Polyangia bacterium]
MRRALCLAAVVFWTSACAQSESVNSGTGGAAGSGGSTGTGGVKGSGGATATGGNGTSGTGGTIGTGGTPGSGGAVGTGGATGGTSGTGGTFGTGGAIGTGGTPGAGGAIGTGGAPGTGGTPGTGGATMACSSALSDRVRITEIDVGASYAYNEVDNNGAALGLTVLAISPIPGGGSRLAFLEKGASTIHIVTLDGNDQVVAGSAFTLPGYDFQDIYADASGGTLLVSRNAMGSTAGNNCGNINNLCGLVANYPTAASCYDMYMVRFDGATETWATKLTDTTATQPAYMTSTTETGDITFVWSEYAHNGRIAFDGANYAGYFGIAISVSQPCVGSSTLTTGINIHQGDRMKVVSSAGALQTTPGFGIGCSHSGYERVIYDSVAKKFIPVCKNDAMTGTKSGRIALAPNTSTIYPVDLSYSDLGNVLTAGGGGDWIISSDIRAGQTANANGLADVHLLHIASTTALTPDKDLMLVSDTENDRAPHLAAYGTGQMLAAWEESTTTGDLPQNDKNRQMYIQVLDSTMGAAPAGSSATSAGPLMLSPNVLGSRYQDFRSFPDGSVAYPAPGSSATKIKILRVLSCS